MVEIPNKKFGWIKKERSIWGLLHSRDRGPGFGKLPRACKPAGFSKKFAYGVRGAGKRRGPAVHAPVKQHFKVLKR